MLNVRSIKDNKKYLKEYFKLCSLEWGEAYKRDDFEDIIDKKACDVLNGSDDNIILVLGLFNKKPLLHSSQISNSGQLRQLAIE